jgi:hypothetical protein
VYSLFILDDVKLHKNLFKLVHFHVLRRMTLQDNKLQISTKNITSRSIFYTFNILYAMRGPNRAPKSFRGWALIPKCIVFSNCVCWTWSYHLRYSCTTLEKCPLSCMELVVNNQWKNITTLRLLTIKQGIESHFLTTLWDHFAL